MVDKLECKECNEHIERTKELEKQLKECQYLLTSDAVLVRGVAMDFLHFLQTTRVGGDIPSKDRPEECDEFIQSFFDFMTGVYMGVGNEG